MSTIPATFVGAARDVDLRKQTCSAGCVAGLMVMAGLLAMVACLLVCCFSWPAPELISRQERRAAALKRKKDREEEDAEARAKNEELDMDDDDEEEQQHQTREAPAHEPEAEDEDDSEEL